MVVSDHHWLNYPLNPIDSWCPRLLGESSEMIPFLPHMPNLAPLVAISISIDLFHNNFPPSGTQPEHRKLAHEL